jgi:hypothetical protein
LLANEIPPKEGKNVTFLKQAIILTDHQVGIFAYAICTVIDLVVEPNKEIAEAGMRIERTAELFLKTAGEPVPGIEPFQARRFLTHKTTIQGFQLNECKTGLQSRQQQQGNDCEEKQVLENDLHFIVFFRTSHK